LCTYAIHNFIAGNAGGNGDPHFITLDGKQYTFNGLGEYTLLDAQNGEFVINIQTKQAVDQSDRPIKATSISVIAMKMRNKPVIQAQLDDVFEIKVLIESNSSKDGYRDLDFEFAPSRKFNGGQVDVETEFSRVFTFENGVVIIIKASNDILSFQLSVPQTFRDNTKGLLGVWNGDQSDDFCRPDGTIISINSDESDIFEQFGEMCMLSMYLQHCSSQVVQFFLCSISNQFSGCEHLPSISRTQLLADVFQLAFVYCPRPVIC